ncbi:MAG: hypothetical protein LQ347_003775 [Umbilicaria vellea]|nr:MAG: hypothetical protein LQ347_003775 [Umbilicaria vellea]
MSLTSHNYTRYKNVMVYKWSNFDRHYTLEDATFTKRELLPHERRRNMKGKVIKPLWSKERLENERAALDFIAANTTIPVPKVLEFDQREGGYFLTTERVDGVELDELSDNDRPKALQNARIFIEEEVLPQLRNLRSAFIGGLTGFIIPPSRVSTRDKRLEWPQKSSSCTLFVFCHNDLAQHNILVDPKTLRVKAIIDWELSGFFPPEFEAKLWLESWKERREDDEDTSRLIEFLINPGETSEEAQGDILILCRLSALTSITLRHIVANVRECRFSRAHY